jgi:hypothetical protein
MDSDAAEKVLSQIEPQPVKDDSLEDKDWEDESQMMEVKTLLSWHAPGRPYKNHSVEYYVNAFLITLAVEIILFFFSQYLLMMVVLSLAFLSFALAAIPPRTFLYSISTEGIRVEDYFFIWEELYDFYFIKQHGQEVLHIRTRPYFPGELTITLDNIPVNQIKSILLFYLPFREYVKPTFMERAGNWLEKNFPLERSTIQ